VNLLVSYMTLLKSLVLVLALLTALKIDIIRWTDKQQFYTGL